MKGVGIVLCLFIMLLYPIASEAWFATHHMCLAEKAEGCIPLPKPLKKRCVITVDDLILKASLRAGSAVPDVKDGSSSTKHAFNPEYDTRKYNPAIKSALNIPNPQINAGTAIETIEEEIKNTKSKLNLNCDSKLREYAGIWYQFGQLSHYPADLAVPLHAYSVGVDNKYHEGDINDIGDWFRGLWDLTKGQSMHTFLEFWMGAHANFDLLSCTTLAPIEVSKNARSAMKEYKAKYGTGYEGLIEDFFLSSIDAGFFGNIGQQQAQDAISGICSAWNEALQDWKPPSDCKEEPAGDCENAYRPPPGGDWPDDTFSVSTLSPPSTSEELLEQAWDRLAVKKNKKSLMWYWMQGYLLEEFYQGKIDEETYQRLAGSYGLTADVASELFYDDYVTTPDVSVLGRGFALSMSDLLQNKLNEPVRRFTVDDFSPDALKDYPIFIIPSGGLMGLENSDIFRVKLDEYVKQGGTLIVFAQQHGYEFSVLPVPQEEDGSYKRISGYGWSEDQSCFYSAAYIDTWHQMLAGQSRSTPNFHMDGYFTSYPSDVTVLLRRTANGQPALLLYEYGQGRVIVTSIYSDFALKQNQTSSDEISLIRDMISWAKKPDELAEVKPGQRVNVSLTVTNNTANDASSVKLSIYNPDRTILLSEQSLSLPIPAGQSATIPATYTTAQTSALGIYHIDYILYDSSGTIIQPQAETDSGRFVVSNSPQSPAQVSQLTFSIQSDVEDYIAGSTVNLTIIAFNNSDVERTVIAKVFDFLIFPVRTETLIISAKGSNSFTYSKIARPERFWGSLDWGNLRVTFHENDKYLGTYIKAYRVYLPTPGLTVKTEKTIYTKGETVTISASVKNNIHLSWQPLVRINVQDPNYKIVFVDEKIVPLSPYGTGSVVSSFILPMTLMTGNYLVGGNVSSSFSYAYTRFEIPQSQISVASNLPFPFLPGTNTIPFTITNTGKINVFSGTIDLSLEDPDGSIVYSANQPFGLAVKESKMLDIPISIPSLKLGSYTLTYSQSDETRTGKPTIITIPNSFNITNLTFDRMSYRVRETANLTVGLRNTGKFNLENILVTVAVPDANFTDAKTISLGINPSTTSLNFTIPIPETITAGQHHVDVTVALSSGTSFAKRITLTVPESSLAIGYLGTDTVLAGETINLTIENTGGVDTTYTAEKLSLVSQGVEIYQGSATGAILSGEKKALVDIQIPAKAVSGPGYLNVHMKDSKTGGAFNYYNLIEIKGLAASLQTKTEKNTYLKTESIKGISNIVNGSFGIDGGSLKVVVNRVKTAGIEGSSHFLPKEGWVGFNFPSGIVTGFDGSVYVADTRNNLIQKFDGNGAFITKWGSQGSGDGQFENPEGIAAGRDGSIYVADTWNQRIQKFDSNGVFITKWGSEGSEDGQFENPEGIAVGLDGSVYVADNGNNRIQKFDGHGNFIMKWESLGNRNADFKETEGIAVGSDGFVYVSVYLEVFESFSSIIRKFDSNGNFITEWGSYGYGDGELSASYGIAVGPDGFVYVADTYNSRIQKFDSNGNFIMKWGTEGSGDGEFDHPHGIAVGFDGFIYVADTWKNRTQKFDSNGNFVTKWGSKGNGDGQFDQPSGIAVGRNGYFYVVDEGNYRIQKFDSDGNFVLKWGSEGIGDGEFENPSGIAIGPDGSVYVGDSCGPWFCINRIQKFDSNGNFIMKWGRGGSGNGQFNSPSGIAVGSDGSVYVAESCGPWACNNRIQKFDRNGSFITKWGSEGSGDGQFEKPHGIAVGPDGYVYVVDTENHRIQKFDGTGNFIAKWGSEGSGDGQFEYPYAINVGSDGLVYVADSGNNRIQKFDSNGNFIMKWGGRGTGNGEYHWPTGVAVAPDGFVYISDSGNDRIQRYIAETLFETTLPINQAASSSKDYTTDIGTLNTTGKLYLQAILANSLGQTLAQSSYPFYIFEGDTFLLFNTDKKVHRLGETVTITGQIENRASIDAVGMAFSLHSKLNIQNSELVFTEIFDISAGGTHPFTVTATAGTEGTVTLTGRVTQNNSTLVEIADQYEVAKPNVSASVATPDIVGNEGFQIMVEMRNTGKVNATVQFGVQSSEFGDSKTITISPGETKLVQYQQKIYQTTAYIFTFSGDLNQTITKSVTYGLGATIQFEVGGSEFGVFPEGNVGVPFTITNTGRLTETVEVSFELNPGAVKQSKTYSLPQAGSTTNTLYFNLTEGDYQLTASSQLPTASARASFSVRKENKVEMTVSLGTQTNGLIPVTVNLNNIGYNEISGSINVSLSPSTVSGQTVWNAEEAFFQLQPQTSQLITFEINPSAIQPGDYGLRVELLSNNNQQLALSNQLLTIKGPLFQISQPAYQTFYAGQEATFIFRVKNTGNQEGSFDLRLKGYDLIDSTQREWLKPNEEKDITFRFMLPEDLEEKDYFATYELKAEGSQLKGQIKYHLAGISLNVNASLDKPYYSEGETAHLTINLQSTNPNPQNLFARLNYAGYEPLQTFTLNGSQVLIFDVPLSRITGEKLFYGIYHESGRSIHLNSLYIHKAGDVITITTDKQVYNPGEIVSVSVVGSATGNMTLSAPGGYAETFAFSGQVTRNFTLPSTMTASTYFINVQLSTPTSELITVAHPFDVAGIQVKVLECQNDKSKYASSDTITTSFTITSNTAMPAILKAWIVDPTGQYSTVGESKIDIFSSENSLTTLQSPLLTSVSGIHRFIYGIYTGDLLLASGSEAFDVGDAVLLGLLSDRSDYPVPNEPVNVRTGMYGTVDANLELQIDGIAVRNQTVNLNGFSTLNIDIGMVKPGVHVLRGVLTAGGLSSTKETSFIYGSSLPDLIIQLTWDQAIEQSSMKLTITAVNQGKTAAGPTVLNLYDGIFTPEKLLATLDVNALSPGQSQILSYNFNLLGRAGSNTIYAVIDPNNTVLEFNESNNEGQITITVPDLTLYTTLEKEVNFIGDTIIITVLITNLSKAPSAGITLNTTVRDASDVLAFTNSQNISSIDGSTTIMIPVPWQTDINVIEGIYTIHQAIEGKNIKTQKTVTLKQGKDFTIASDIAAQRVEIGEVAQYSLILTPIKGFSGEISLSLEGYPQGCTVYFTPNPVSIIGEKTQSILKVISADPTSCGSYSMKVNASGEGKRNDLTLLLDLTDFQMNLNPPTQTIQQLDEATFAIILNPLNGFDSPVTLEVDGLPRGMRANLTATQVTLPKEVTLTLATSKWLLSGQYAVDIIAKGRTITHTATATLVVNKNPLIPRGVITAPGPGPKNKAIINTFGVNGGILGHFEAFDTKYGANLAAGDVEGDGIDEIIVGTVYKNQKNPALLGIFKRDGTTLAIKEMDHRDKEYGLTVASGDIDGDWIEEVVVGYYTGKQDEETHGRDPSYGMVKIYKYTSGQLTDTGIVLRPYQKERYESAPNIALADVDGDGVPELVTAPGPDPNALAKIKVFKIDTREGVGRWKISSQLAEFVVDFGEKGRHEGRVEFNKDKDGNSRYGANIAGGDIDGDGREEIIVGAGPDPTNTSVIKVYRGDGTFTGIQFTAFPDQHSNHGGKESDHEMESHYRYGVYVAAGDIDEDGISEIIAGTGPDPKNNGWVRIFIDDGAPMGNGFLAYPEEMKYGARPSGINLIR